MTPSNNLGCTSYQALSLVTRYLLRSSPYQNLLNASFSTKSQDISIPLPTLLGGKKKTEKNFLKPLLRPPYTLIFCLRILRKVTVSAGLTKMAPPKATTTPPYSKDEKVLCFHHEMLYEAKILEVQQGDDSMFQYKIHYKGWKNTWDDWVPQDRIRKFNDENRELAAQLMQQARASLQKSSKPTKKAALKNGSDFSSVRGSEERTGAAAVSGRGPRRARDYDMEHVSTNPFFLLYSINRS